MKKLLATDLMSLERYSRERPEFRARVIAHKNATARLKKLADPHTVIPDESIGDKKTIKLGGTTLELSYHGLNHSASTLVMRLPREKNEDDDGARI